MIRFVTRGGLLLMPVYVLAVNIEVPRVSCFPVRETMSGSDLSLVVPADQMTGKDRTPREGGRGRVYWDDQGLIVEFNLQDSDILAYGRKDQLQQNELGDVLEIFLQPPGKIYYWELFVTPHGYQSSLFWDRTVSMKWDKTPEKRIHLEVRIAPLENREGWVASVLIPFCDLTRLGDPSPEKAPWKMLVARQNYTGAVRKSCRELSSFPPLDKSNFHATDCFAEIHLNKETLK